jgi:flavin reductase (DIM6/NTAB) family NADH-FMN oxidoreductase RutF
MNAIHRRPVPLAKAYRLLNHGPTVLVSAAHGGQRNIMAAAWAMPVDFDPPKVAVVLDESTWTRTLLEGAGTFALQVPTRAQVDLTDALGNSSGREIIERDGRWNFTRHDEQRTLHHVAGGHFIVDGDAVDAQPLARAQP